MYCWFNKLYATQNRAHQLLLKIKRYTDLSPDDRRLSELEADQTALNEQLDRLADTLEREWSE